MTRRLAQPRHAWSRACFATMVAVLLPGCATSVVSAGPDLSRLAGAKPDEYVLDSRRYTQVPGWSISLATYPVAFEHGLCTTRIRIVYLIGNHRSEVSRGRVVFLTLAEAACSGKPTGDLAFVDDDALPLFAGAMAIVERRGLAAFASQSSCRRHFPGNMADLRISSAAVSGGALVLRYMGASAEDWFLSIHFPLSSAGIDERTSRIGCSLLQI